MARSDQHHIPPGTFLGDVLRAVVGHIVAAVDRFDPRPAVAFKPRLPNLPARLVLAIAPQRVDVITAPPWILLQRVDDLLLAASFP